MFEKLCALKNKKGFTLIEMLVVIAIIAVLVAIAIPVVGSSTNKAACAANAANLRSIKAEVTTAFLTNDTTNYDFVTSGTTITVTPKSTHTLPTSKKTSTPSCDAGVAPTISIDKATNEVTVKYGANDINAFADVAGGETPTSSSDPS